MNSVGIDLHRKHSHVAAIDDAGEQLLARQIENNPATFLELLAELNGESRIALEATYGWDWLVELLEGAGYEVHLAHPLRTRAIASARVKTDAVDARTLAHLLRADLLPEAYIPPRALRDLRDLVRQRIAFTHIRSALKNRLRALLTRNGIRHVPAHLFGKQGQRLLKELELRAEPRRRIDGLLRLIFDLDREIDALRLEIEALAENDPRAQLLCAIRGIGPYTAMIVIAEIGDVSRFPTARHLCAWAGLTPTVRASGGRAHLGPISRQGSVALRWALTQVAPMAASADGPLKEVYKRIAERRGRRVARVAVARRLLTLCFYALRDGEIRCLGRSGTASAECSLAANPVAAAVPVIAPQS